MTAGVPRGSILGPTLFNIVINDIPIVEGCTLALYADDTTLLCSSWQVETLVATLQYFLNQIVELFDTWKLTVNPPKTQAIFFNRYSPIPTEHHLSINNVTIPWSREVRYLGLVFHKSLTWSAAVHDRVKKVRVAAAVLRPHLCPASHLSARLRLIMYMVCLRPVLTYGSQVWSCAAPSVLSAATVSQSGILKIILGRSTWYSTFRFLYEAGVEPLLDYIYGLNMRYSVGSHHNPLVRMTGTYDHNRIPYNVKIHLPLHFRP